jgi:hypothetical protein
MLQLINEAIALLQSAAAATAEEARPKVLQAMTLLAEALKDEVGIDVDKGGGN